MAKQAAGRTAPALHPQSTHVGDRLPSSAGALRRAWHYHGLSIVLIALFLITMLGQIWSGWYVYNAQQLDHGQRPVALASYLLTGHFGEATFENFESEFLQMAFYVVLTVFLYQKGSAESKRPDVVEPVDLDPAGSPNAEYAPWPVRRGGLVLRIYQNSLSLAFAILFVLSFGLHAWTGLAHYNEEQLQHGGMPVTLGAFATSSQFWFESLQNWQSEFLSLAAMVTFTIFLRQRGSPESKPVAAPTWDTGH